VAIIKPSSTNERKEEIDGGTPSEGAFQTSIM
jgi:hypothetical protein